MKLLRICAKLLLGLTCLCCARAAVIVDTCNGIHGEHRLIETIEARTENLVVDKSSPGTYNGDSGRFKRDNDLPGVISYASTIGFEQIEVEGYVYNKLMAGSWSVIINGPKPEVQEISRLDSSNLEEFLMEEADWNRFRIKVNLDSCPLELSVTLEGSASNNEYPGWGLQISEVSLTESWYKGCQPACEFNRTECTEISPVQIVDKAENSDLLYYRSSNIDLDSTDALLYFDGDGSRYIRRNTKKGVLEYYAKKGIHRVDVEIFQYTPYNTELRVTPYEFDECMPVSLSPVFIESGRGEGGWKQKIARFDLESLPFCSTKVAIEISGGNNGWELQISRITLLTTGRLERDPAYLVSFLGRSQSSDSGGVSSDWWHWFVIAISIVAACLFGVFVIRRLALFFGSDETSIYHRSNIKELLGFKKTEERVEMKYVSRDPTALDNREPSFTFRR